MFRTAPRPTHRAPGRAVTDYRGLLVPMGRSMGGAAALGAVTAGVAVTGTGVAEATTTQQAARGGSITSEIPVPSAAPAVSPARAVPARTGIRVQRGARGASVSSLQSALNRHGKGLAVDGVFGHRTDSAVRSFQRSAGLAVDGIAGPRTWAALGSSSSSRSSSSSSEPKLRRGAHGSAVSHVQRLLNSNGGHLAVDGSFGPATNSAVRSYQSNAGIGVDGIVGPRTWSALKSGSGHVSSGSSGSSSSSRGFDGSSIVSLAKRQLGTPYVWGAQRPGGFDCSGLVSYVYRQHGISVPRTAHQQTFGGRIISQSQAVPGDLVAFSAGNWGHIGIYAGHGMIVDASGSHGRVMYRSIWNSPHVFVTYR